MRVFLPRIPSEEFLRVLQERVDPRIEIVCGPELPALCDYEWIVDGAPSAEQLAASPTLRGVIIPWAGLTPRLRDLLLTRPGLQVHNLHDNAPATAELALGLLLAAARRIAPLDRALRSGDWTPGDDNSGDVLLAGKTAVVLGYGEIGKRVAHALGALGMAVVAVRRSTHQGTPGGPASVQAETPRRVACLGPAAMSPARLQSTGAPPAPTVSPGTGDGAVEVLGVSELAAVLPRAEVLVCTLPLTEETRRLLDAAALAQLPAGALVVNVGRGPIFDEDALYEALASGRIGAAGLDVWYRYPRGDDDPRATLPATRSFHELPNVVLSPHRGGATREAVALRAAALATLLSAAFRGEELPNRVDPHRGY